MQNKIQNSNEFWAYKFRTRNIGDEIQSLAAIGMLPKVDHLVERDNFDGIDPSSTTNQANINIIMNGWFGHKPFKFLPVNIPSVTPLCTSMHFSVYFEPQLKEVLSNKASIYWLKKHAPIGCRDLFSVEILNSIGVEAYFSGCLTSTLQKRSLHRNGSITCVDSKAKLPSWINEHESVKFISHYPFYRNIADNEFISKSVSYFKNMISYTGLTEDAVEWKMRFAESCLKAYSEAELVVTSRLHCALPCLAFGTPVVFVHPNAKNPRFSGYENIFTVVDPKEVEAAKNLDQLKSLASKQNDHFIRMRNSLLESVSSFLHGEQINIEHNAFDNIGGIQNDRSA